MFSSNFHQKFIYCEKLGTTHWLLPCKEKENLIMFNSCWYEHLVFHMSHSLEKAMATHSSTLAWKIPWTEEPGRLQSMGSLRVGHDWATSLSLFAFMNWRRKWRPTPVFLPGESQGWEPGGLPSMGSHRVGHDWNDLAAEIFSYNLHICFRD